VINHSPCTHHTDTVIVTEAETVAGTKLEELEDKSDIRFAVGSW
jgi:hypothetical protein